MFTQCTNCQAIFRVSMREVTVSKGLLRCGECHEIFDSSKNLSTTMQDPYVALEKNKDPNTQSSVALTENDDWQHNQTEALNQSQLDLRQSPTETPKSDTITSQKINQRSPFTTKSVRQNPTKNKTTCSTKLHLIVATILALLLALQLGYNYRHLFLNSHKYEPEKILMLNHNVFAHPIEKDVLLISASIKNTADFDQPFPILEVRLTNSKAELVALRRFTPDEYLNNYSTNMLLRKNRATSIKLKIKDPGNQATRFQFDFL